MDELDTLERLVRRYSPSLRETPAVWEFVRLARSLGYSARLDAQGNGIAVRGRGRPRVMFLGHIDTVDGELPVRRTRGRLYGRGAVDAKGPLVAALLAGRGDPGPGEYRVVAAVGEETDGRGARHLIHGRGPDYLIVGEPSGWDGVTIGYKGEVELTAKFRAKRSHFSSPDPTASDLALAWVEALRAFVAGHTGESPFRSLTMKVVGLESRRTGGDEVARVTVDLRLPPGLSTRALLRELRTAPTRPSLEVRLRVEPIELERSNPVVGALVAGIRAVGARPMLWRKGGTSDLNLAVPAWRVPAAAYGPGNARLDHTDREVLSAAELRRAIRVLERALTQLRAVPVTPR